MTGKDTTKLTRRKLLRASAVAGSVMALPASATAAATPYTDIQLVETGPGYVELKYINATPYTYAFDYRADDESGAPHQWTGDTISEGPCAGTEWGPYYNLTNVGPNSETTVTVEAANKVEAEAVLGPEQHYFTCKKTFFPEQPDSKTDCMQGGWDDYHFKNQGQCVRYVQTGKDSR